VAQVDAAAGRDHRALRKAVREVTLTMRILHVLDHSIPLHSGYSYRTLAILRQQRALGWETLHVTSAKHNIATAPAEDVDGLTFYRTLGLARRLSHVGVITGLREG